MEVMMDESIKHERDDLLAFGRSRVKHATEHMRGLLRARDWWHENAVKGSDEDRARRRRMADLYSARVDEAWALLLVIGMDREVLRELDEDGVSPVKQADHA